MIFEFLRWWLLIGFLVMTLIILAAPSVRKTQPVVFVAIWLTWPIALGMIIYFVSRGIRRGIAASRHRDEP